mmetsp:Transcript_8091/g.12692  ORF Transcript_8091/g.12692 Transcript_8091/m.12692 type:complete len:91 (+) Transcript_8091:250-522(+)
MARSLRISQPSPPAPTTNILALAVDCSAPPAEVSNSPMGREPVSLAKGLERVRSVLRDPLCRPDSAGRLVVSWGRAFAGEEFVISNALRF